MACWVLSRRTKIPKRAQLACNLMALAAIAQVIYDLKTRRIEITSL